MSQPSIVRAMQIVNKIVENDDAMFSLYAGIGRMFNPDLSEGDIRACIKEAQRFDLLLLVENAMALKGSIMTCVANKGTIPADASAHMISFNEAYLNVRVGAEHRVTYLHVVKLLHEISHTLTPSFARRTTEYLNSTESQEEKNKKLDTPEKMGAVWQTRRRTIGDAGSAWEESVIGGRVVPGGTASKPYGKALCLYVMHESGEAPDEGNYDEFVLPDSFLESQLAELEQWQPGTALPSLKFTPTEGQVPISVSSTVDQKRKQASSSGGLFPASDSGSSSSSGSASEGSQREPHAGEDVAAAAQPALSAEQFARLQRAGLALTAEQRAMVLSGRKM
jgi:hypothetical protein